MRHKKKVCSKCNQSKRVSEFYAQNGKPISRCKQCHRKMCNASDRRRKDAGDRRCSGCNKWRPISDFVVETVAENRCSLCRKRNPQTRTRDSQTITHGKKKCSRCLQIMPVKNFGKNKSTSSGLQSNCLECQRAAVRAYQTRQRERDLAGWRRRLADTAARWRKNNQERYREVIAQRNLKCRAKKYGLTTKKLAELTNAAAGKCQICGVVAKRLNIDHSHETGEVRGLLCSRCNCGIGLLDDNPDILRRAIQYLS